MFVLLRTVDSVGIDSFTDDCVQIIPLPISVGLHVIAYKIFEYIND